MTKICLCRGIDEKTIVEAIKNGAKTYQEVKEATGAGTGGCGGKRCQMKIEMLINDNK